MTQKNSAPNTAYKAVAGVKQTSEQKMARIPIKVKQPEARLRKPAWIRAKSPFTPMLKN